MFKKIVNIFKKQPVPQESIMDTAMIWELLKTDKYDAAIKEASKLLNSPLPEVNKEANNIVGMALFRQNKYAKAVPFFENAAANSNDASLWFNIATAASLAGDVQKGENAFNTVTQIKLDPEQKQQLSIPFMRLYYAFTLRDIGEYARALVQINELRSIYEQLGVTDSTYVYIRGVPLLSATMDLAVDVFKGLGKSFNAESWISDFSAKLDEEGQAYLAEVKVKLCN